MFLYSRPFMYFGDGPCELILTDKRRGESCVDFYFTNAFAALSRPPLAILPLNESILSTDFSRRSRSLATEMPGWLATINAATPETCGVAIDVPDALRYSSLSQVERMSLPGAAMCTVLGP